MFLREREYLDEKDKVIDIAGCHCHRQQTFRYHAARGWGPEVCHLTAHLGSNVDGRRSQNAFGVKRLWICEDDAVIWNPYVNNALNNTYNGNVKNSTY